MLDAIQSTVRPLMLDEHVLEEAYKLYLAAPQSSLPIIDLRSLSDATGKKLLYCRNTIVEANSLGRFPDCSLQT